MSSLPPEVQDIADEAGERWLLIRTLEERRDRTEGAVRDVTEAFIEGLRQARGR